MSTYRYKRISSILFIVLQFIFAQVSFSQDEEPEKKYHFNGNISVTSNGFSLIPTFSLGKPATIAELSLGGNRFSFDPQFRFDLAGLKPWSFIFIWRYKLKQTNRWLVRAGVHLPAVAFREQTFQKNGTTVEQLVPFRFLGLELTINYAISKKVSVGMYYIYGLGLEKQPQPQHTHYLAFRAGFNKIPLGKKLFFNWNPQIYYLNIDGADGIYGAQLFVLGHKKLPFSISSMMNVKIESDVPSKDFDWNFSLVYTFKNQLVRK